jgi:hypothetical protein
MRINVHCPSPPTPISSEMTAFRFPDRSVRLAWSQDWVRNSRKVGFSPRLLLDQESGRSDEASPRLRLLFSAAMDARLRRSGWKCRAKTGRNEKFP